MIAELNLEEARKLVLSKSSVAKLEDLEEQERSSRGRKSVLKLIRDRKNKLRHWHSVLPKYVAVVSNLTDDAGLPIKKGDDVSRLSRERLSFFLEIGGVEERR